MHEEDRWHPRRRRRRCPVGVCKKDLRVLVERAIAMASSMAFGHGRRPPYKAMHVVGVLIVLQQARRTRCPARPSDWSAMLDSWHIARKLDTDTDEQLAAVEARRTRFIVIYGTRFIATATIHLLRTLAI